MAANERRTDPDLAAARLASARCLVVKLEAAHRAGTLKPIKPEAKPVTMAIRVKAARPGAFPETEPAGFVSISAESFREHIYRQVEGWHEHPQQRTWATEIQTRAHHNKAACALANKLARVCYAVLRDHVPYGNPQPCQEKKLTRTAFAIAT